MEMYHDSVEALKQLLCSTVIRISARTGQMRNGISYCAVQVLLAGGEEFMLEAYNEEAEELCKVARGQLAVRNAS
jgi:hypothetical protein